MSVGLFIERGCPPKQGEISAAVGRMLALWNELNRWLSERCKAGSELRFMYGKKYGWARRFEIRGSLLTALYPTQNGFTVQVILNRSALEQASRVALGENATQAIDRAHPYAEGKWLFVPVESERDVADVKMLLSLKVESPKERSPKRSAVSTATG